MSPVLRVVTVFVIAAVAHTVAPARAEMSAEELAFQRALRGLLEQLPLRLDLQALVNQWYYFYERSIGCIGVLKDWLVRTLAATLYSRFSRALRWVRTCPSSPCRTWLHRGD